MAGEVPRRGSAAMRGANWRLGGADSIGLLLGSRRCGTTAWRQLYAGLGLSASRGPYGGPPSKPPVHHITIVPKGLRGAHNWPPLGRETPFCRTAIVSFPSAEDVQPPSRRCPSVIDATIRRATAREARASRHHGGLRKSPPQTSRTSRQYGAQGLEGFLNMASVIPRGMSIPYGQWEKLQSGCHMKIQHSEDGFLLPAKLNEMWLYKKNGTKLIYGWYKINGKFVSIINLIPLNLIRYQHYFFVCSWGQLWNYIILKQCRRKEWLTEGPGVRRWWFHERHWLKDLEEKDDWFRIRTLI